LKCIKIYAPSSNNPQEYGISSIENADEYFYKENYNYKSTNQVPYERMMEIANLVNMQSMSKVVLPGPERKGRHKSRQ